MRLPGNISAGQQFLLVVFLALGVFSAFQIPYGAGFDEEQHLRRAWEMSALVLVPNAALGPDMPIPASFTSLSYRNLDIVRRVPWPVQSHLGKLKLGDEGWIYDRAQTRSVYSPLVLAPQTLSVRYLGRKFNVPFFWMLFASRVLGLLAYGFLVYLAIRIIPFGKWLFTLLALTPTALFQASTVSADTITNGVGFLFIAGVLALSRKDRLGWKSWALLLGLIALLFSVKINIAVLALLPFMLIKPVKFRMKAGYFSLLLAAFILFLVEIVGWYLLTSSTGPAEPGQAQPLQQLLFLANHPAFFFGGVLQDLASNGPAYLAGLIAAYGYYYWTVPGLVYVAVIVAIAASLLTEQGDAPNTRDRISFIAVLILSYLATTLLLQLTAEQVGSETIHELHGRYFTPLIPLLFLALIGSIPWRSLQPSRAVRFALISGLLGLGLFALGSALAYHVTCGSSYYSLQRCYLPQYKNWGPDQNPLDPLDEIGRVQQTFAAECSQLAGVRVWAAASSKPGTGTVLMTIFKDGNSDPLATRDMNGMGLTGSEWLYLELPEPEASQNHEYRLELEASGGQADSQGLRLGLTQKPEYKAGELMVGGHPDTLDLFFQYGCDSGLRTLLGR